MKRFNYSELFLACSLIANYIKNIKNKNVDKTNKPKKETSSLHS